MIDSLVPTRRLARRPAPRLRALALALMALVAALLPAAAAAQAYNPSGLPLPRFASLRSQPINVRVGPGTRYDIAWVFVAASLPVEIVQEFDTWRKIRDVTGEEGWVHQNLLSGQRMGYVAPWRGEDPLALFARADTGSSVRAWLGAGLLVTIEGCDGEMCRVIARDPTGSNRSSYSGFVAQAELWGAYPGEVFD